MMNPSDISNILKVLQKNFMPFEVEQLRDDVAIFLDKFRKLPKKDRASVQAQFGAHQSEKLLRCAQELAVRAVRNNVVDDVELGLLAVVLEDIRVDFRNTILSLCLLYHSSSKLGFDPSPIFHKAASFATPKTAKFMLDYLHKGEKNIREFAMEEGQGPNGFDYVVFAM